MWISTRSSLTFRSSREQPLVRAEPRLRLRVPRDRRGAHPLELGLERTLAGRLLLLLGREPRLLLLEPTGVVALVRDPAAAVELEDPAGDVVEEVPVVSDGDDGARVLGEEPLEPGDRLGVEMVRRLVQEQQVRRGQEQPAQSDAPPLASGEGCDVAVALGHPKRVHRAVELGVERPRVAPVDLLLHLGLLGEQRVVVGVWLGELRRDRVEAVEQVTERPHAVLDVAANVLGGIEVRLLRQEADRRAGRELGATARRLLDAGHDPQQRRFPGPVRTEHADLRAR